MATQRYISTSFWDDPWITSLTYDEKYLYLYLLTNPLTNIAGVYQIAANRIVFDTGLPAEKVSATLEKFKDSGKAYYRDGYIILPTWPKHQKWKEHKKIETGIRRILEEIKPILLTFLKEIGYTYPIDSLSIPYTYPSNYSDLDPDTDRDTDTAVQSPLVDNSSAAKTLADQFNKHFAQATGQTILTVPEDIEEAQKIIDRGVQIEEAIAMIPKYFTCKAWFLYDRSDTERRTPMYSLRNFVQHYSELVSLSAQKKSEAEPRKPKICPVPGCGNQLVGGDCFRCGYRDGDDLSSASNMAFWKNNLKRRQVGNSS